MSFFKKYYWGIIPILCWVIIRFGFDFNGLYGQDAYAYLLHTRDWKAFFLGGNIPGPFFWPPNYSIVSGVIALIVQSEFYATQLVSVGSLIGLAWAIDKWIKGALTLSENARIAFVSLSILMSPYLLRLGLQSMSDMLAMFLLSSSFYLLWKYLENESTRALSLWSLVTALALTTRYPSIVVLSPAILYVTYRLITQRLFFGLIMGFVVASIPISLAIWWKTDSMGVYGVTENELFQQWNPTNFFRSEFQLADTNSRFLFPNLLFNLSAAIHPGAIFFGAILLPFSFNGLRQSPFRIIILLAFLTYAIFLSGVPFQNSRVMIFTFPLIVIFMSFGFQSLLDRLEAKRIPVKLAFIICILTQTSLCVRAMQPSIKMNRFERELADWVIKNHPEKAVYTSEYSQLFDAYETGNSVVLTFGEAVLSFEDNSIFIFNESMMDFKIKGTMPHHNWENANRIMLVQKEMSWPNGWSVYSMKVK